MGNNKDGIRIEATVVPVLYPERNIIKVTVLPVESSSSTTSNYNDLWSSPELFLVPASLLTVPEAAEKGSTARDSVHLEPPSTYNNPWSSNETSPVLASHATSSKTTNIRSIACKSTHLTPPATYSNPWSSNEASPVTVPRPAVLGPTDIRPIAEGAIPIGPPCLSITIHSPPPDYPLHVDQVAILPSVSDTLGASPKPIYTRSIAQDTICLDSFSLSTALICPPPGYPRPVKQAAGLPLLGYPSVDLSPTYARPVPLWRRPRAVATLKTTFASNGHRYRYPEFQPGNPIVQRNEFNLHDLGYQGANVLKDFSPWINSAFPNRIQKHPPVPKKQPVTSYFDPKAGESERALLHEEKTVESENIITDVTDFKKPNKVAKAKYDSDCAIITDEESMLDGNDDSDKENVIPTRSRGEALAETIRFHELSEETTPEINGAIYSQTQQREDFVRNIDAGAEMEYCRRCGRNHIPPGPPITLADRDTCGAYLPDWFPLDQGPYYKPWNSFRGMLNDWVHAQEIKQGYGHKSEASPKWNLKFHDYDKKWKQVGRKEGWWKCRDGPNAPQVERECILCHNSYDVPLNIPSSRVSGDVVMEHITRWVKEAGEKDKAIVLARIREGGWPQIMGPWEAKHIRKF